MPWSCLENLLRIAEIKEVRLNDVDGAILAYHDAFESDPNCVDALLSLEQLYRQQKNAYELQKVYESLIIARTNSNDQLNTEIQDEIRPENLHDYYPTIEITNEIWEDLH